MHTSRFRPRHAGASVAAPAAALLFALLPTSGSATSGIAALRWLNPNPQGNSIEALAFESSLVGYAVGVRGTTLRTTDGGASWTDLSDPIGFFADLRDLEVLAPGTLLAIGTGAGIYRSTNAGESWHVVTNPSIGPLTHLDRLDANTFSAVGDDGQRLLSTDGGMHWTLGGSTGLAHANGQSWLSPTHGWVVGWLGVVETTNGGTTWNAVPLEGIEFFDVQFSDASNGWLSEAFSMYRTTDGGTTWVPMPATPLYINTQVVYSTTHRLLLSAGEGAEIWETHDDGASWTELYIRLATVGYNDVALLPDGRLVVASSDGDLLFSDDDGASWTNSTEGPGDENRFDLWSLHHGVGGRGLAFGVNEDWLRSEDDGTTWVRETSPLGAFTYETEFWDDDLLGLAAGVGSGTALARTTDGGTTWDTHIVHGTFLGGLAGVDFVDEEVVWVAYAGPASPRVHRSTDGGRTWEPRSGGIAANAGVVNCISFVDADHGFIAGDWLSPTSKLLRTTDGGLNWTSVPVPDQVFQITDTKWVTREHGFIVARTDIYETTDGGATWSSALAADVSEMSWLDATHGCAFFHVGTTLHLTRDGGATWVPIEIPWSTGVLDADWVASDRLWISGYGCRLLEITLLEPASVPEGGEPGTSDGPEGGGGTPDPTVAGGMPTAEAPILLRELPTRARLRIALRSLAAGEATIAWYDPAGRRLLATDRGVAAGITELELPIPDTQTHAVLFLRVVLPDGQQASRRIVVLP